MKQHTPEPWARGTHSADNGEEFNVIFGCDGRVVVGDDVITEANARRIVACVNACAGLPIEQLESSPLGGVLNGVAGLITQRDDLQAQIDELLAALKTIGMHTITDEDGDEIEVLFGNIGKIRDAITKFTGEIK